MCIIFYDQDDRISSYHVMDVIEIDDVSRLYAIKFFDILPAQEAVLLPLKSEIIKSGSTFLMISSDIKNRVIPHRERNTGNL